MAIYTDLGASVFKGFILSLHRGLATERRRTDKRLVTRLLLAESKVQAALGWSSREDDPGMWSGMLSSSLNS